MYEIYRIFFSTPVIILVDQNLIGLMDMKGVIVMPNQGLKQSELNWIREVVSCHNMSASKLNAYASQVQDPQLQSMFSNASRQAKQAAQNLLQML